nr:uncharacterized protein LOC109156522 [Ipomoea trifida]
MTRRSRPRSYPYKMVKPNGWITWRLVDSPKEVVESSGESSELARGAQAQEVAKLAKEVRDMQRKVEGWKNRRTAQSLLSTSLFTKDIWKI